MLTATDGVLFPYLLTVERMGDLETTFRTAVDAEIGARTHHHAFAVERYAEGEKALAYLRRRYPEHLREHARVLDVGGGNGGFVLPFAESGFDRLWVDRVHAVALANVLRRANVGLRRILADAECIA